MSTVLAIYFEMLYICVCVCVNIYVFPGGSDSKASACNAGDLGSIPWVGKIPWRRKLQPTPVLLPGESGRRSLVGYSPWGSKESDAIAVFTLTLTGLME